MQLLETIQIKNGTLQHIEYHNNRLNASRADLFDCQDILKLENIMKIPSECSEGIFRCRVIYSKEIEEITFVPYVYKEIRTLKLVDIGDWDYSYKYADRSFLTKLLTENQKVDEVIMTKNGFITDCTIANLAFYDGKNWVTPSTPLLKGTKRQQLLDRQEITEKEIKIKDLENYQGVCLINTFRELSSTGFQPVSTIIQ
ncbi:4-amino-4-deoxychorismate lyase [Arcicella aurantiaca]|uniref:4-amino-4-deoxychorismate lyase n=1 Tax=Arcicella aurantiaca TaxID=591202 RepID=A0A316EGK3_9BACT|nr:aminotransferase class IV [Arcicella aurantiaca]PWK29204.1 4-amino-4-deoxychorismate lyase [Arcicella aurantiaca]